MRLTIINEYNEKAFIPFMTDASDPGGAELIRIGAVDTEGYAAGALVARADDMIIDIISLYVDPKRRRQGFAKMMIDALAALTRPDENTFISVRFIEDDDLYAFFEAMGFELIYDMSLEYITLRYVRRSDIFKRSVLKAGSSDVLPIAQLDRINGNKLARYLKKMSLGQIGSFDPAASSVCINGEEIISILLADVIDNDTSILWMDFKAGHQKNLFKHLNRLVKYMESDPRFDEDSKICFAPENRKFSETLVRLSVGKDHIKKSADYIYGVMSL